MGDIQRVIGTNLVGAFLTAQAAAPQIHKIPGPDHRQIVMTVSVQGRRGRRWPGPRRPRRRADCADGDARQRTGERRHPGQCGGTPVVRSAIEGQSRGGPICSAAFPSGVLEQKSRRQAPASTVASVPGRRRRKFFPLSFKQPRHPDCRPVAIKRADDLHADWQAGLRTAERRNGRGQMYGSNDTRPE